MDRHNSNPTRQTIWRCATLLLLLIAFALRLQALSLQDIWWDEARNIDVALRPFLAIPSAPELDIHPPIYFWLLHLWGRLMNLGNSAITNPASLNPPAVIAFSTRYLSLFAGVLSVALLHRLIKISAPRVINPAIAAFFAALIGALSPFWLAESQETRMYTLGFALLSAAAIAFIAAQRSTTSRTKYLALFAIGSAAALLVHYNAVFILVTWFVWWFVQSLLWPHPSKNRWHALKTLFLTGIGLTLLVLPITPIALRQIPGYENPNLTIPSWQSYLVQNWQAYLGGYPFTPDMFGVSQYFTGTNWLWITACLLALGLGLVIALSLAVNPMLRRSVVTVNVQSPRPQHTPLAFLFVWLFGGLALYYIAVLDRGAFNVRYSSFVTPALYAVLGIALAAFSKLGKIISIIVAVIIAMGMGIASYVDLYDSRFAREDMSSTAAWLHENTSSNDLILVDQKYPFGFYHQRYAIDPLEPLTNEATNAGEAAARYLFVDANTIDQTLTEWAEDVERLFYVRWFESDTDPRRTVTFLLDGNGTRVGKKEFRGYSITWWDLDPPNQFQLASGLVAATHVFQPAVEVIAQSLLSDPVVAGSEAPIVLRWRRIPTGFVNRELKARVSLHETNGASILSQDDRLLLNDRHLRTPEWTLDDQPLNVYELPIPTDLAAGEYEVRLIIYDAETLEARTYFDIAGNPAGIEAKLGIVQISK
mgnify:CR=1 FL=1